MTDPKAALPQTLATVPDTSTLGTQLSSLALTDESANSPPSESRYQVFIFAGFGHNLYPLTEENNLPKALLPVANTPLIYFPLEWCSKAGFSNVTVVCHKESVEQISAYTSSLSFNMQVKVEGSSSVEDNLSTADVLSLISDTIINDFIVLSCDTFTNLPPSDILTFHESQNSSATAVFFDKSMHKEPVDPKAKDTKKKAEEQSDNDLYVAYEKSSHKLLFLKTAIEVHESLDVRTSLLWRYPRTNFSTTLHDAHIYIFKRWVVDLICKNEKISSLRNDLLPVLAKMQWQSNLRKREGLDELLPPVSQPLSTSPKDDSSDPLPVNLRTPSPISVSLYVAPQYTIRANNLRTYLSLNYHQASLAPDPRKHPSSTAGSKTSVGNDSLVAEGCTLGERVQVRKSILSKGVTVGSKTQIKGSVVMEGVVLGDMVTLDGCVVCKGAKVGKMTSLKECFVGAVYEVEEGTKLQKQNLVDVEEFSEDEEEEEED